MKIPWGGGQVVAGSGSALLNYSLFPWNAQDLQENTKYREFSVCNLAVRHLVSVFPIETN